VLDVLNAIESGDTDNPAGPPLRCEHRYHAVLSALLGASIRAYVPLFYCSAVAGDGEHLRWGLGFLWKKRRERTCVGQLSILTLCNPCIGCFSCVILDWCSLPLLGLATQEGGEVKIQSPSVHFYKSPPLDYNERRTLRFD